MYVSNETRREKKFIINTTVILLFSLHLTFGKETLFFEEFNIFTTTVYRYIVLQVGLEN